jgi:membrane protease YdiL (CAAX protease family)
MRPEVIPALRPYLAAFGLWWRWLWASRLGRLAVLGALPVCLLLASLPHVRLWVPGSVAAWLTLLLWQPLLEELAFRGGLQGALLALGARRQWCGLSVANVLTSVAFVLAHLWRQPGIWALAVLLPSLMLGALRERLGSVWPVVAVHIYYNGLYVLAASLQRLWL